MTQSAICFTSLALVLGVISWLQESTRYPNFWTTLLRTAKYLPSEGEAGRSALVRIHARSRQSEVMMSGWGRRAPTSL